MTSIQKLEARIESLETQMMFQDDLIEQLNQALITQQADLAKLVRLAERLGNQLEELKQPHIAAMADETPPPHY